MPIAARPPGRSGFTIAIAPEVARRQLRVSLALLCALALICAALAGSVGRAPAVAGAGKVRLTFQQPFVEAALETVRF